MERRISEARHRSGLCSVTAVWRKVATSLDVRIDQAARFVEQCIEEHSYTLYEEDDGLGLSFPVHGSKDAAIALRARCEAVDWKDDALAGSGLQLALVDAAAILVIAKGLMPTKVGHGHPLHRADPELDELARTYVEKVQEFAKSKPRQFSELICRSVLLEDVSTTTSVSFGPVNEHLLHVAESYRPLARLMLADLQGERPELPSSGYFSVRQWVESECFFHCDALRWWDYVSERTQDIWGVFFQEAIDSLSSAVTLATHLINQGLPVYELHQDQFKRLPDGSPLAYYLRGRGEAFDVVTSRSLPDWAERLYFSAEHLRWHHVFFANEGDAKPEEIQIQAAAYRRHLGLPTLDAIRPSERSDAEESALATRERDTMLRIIMASAIGGYGYDPSATRSEVPKSIETDAAAAGISVTDDTVRKYLKEAASRVGGSRTK